MTTLDRLYTINEAAPLMGMRPTTLRDRVGPRARARGRQIPHLRVHGGRGVRFTEAHIAAYRASCETSPNVAGDDGAPAPIAPQLSPSLAALIGVRARRM